MQAFSVKDDQYRQPIGEDAGVFRLQIEDLVNAAITGATTRGATAEDGLASVRAMVALAKSVITGDWVKLDDVTEGWCDTGAAGAVAAYDSAVGSSLTIRPARVEDVPQMARVIVRSWQETYRGLMSDAVLDDPDSWLLGSGFGLPR